MNKVKLVEQRPASLALPAHPTRPCLFETPPRNHHYYNDNSPFLTCFFRFTMSTRKSFRFW